MAEDLKAISKFLSLILRHQPETIGLILDAQGWANVDELIAQANHHGKVLSYDSLVKVVANNDKQRFSLSNDGLRIRANQGHSLTIDLALTAKQPLYLSDNQVWLTDVVPADYLTVLDS